MYSMSQWNTLLFAQLFQFEKSVVFCNKIISLRQTTIGNFLIIILFKPDIYH